MTDRLSDEILDHLIETHRGTLADANKRGQTYAPVKNLEQTIKGLEEAKEKRAEAKMDAATEGARRRERARHAALLEKLLFQTTGDV